MSPTPPAEAGRQSTDSAPVGTSLRYGIRINRGQFLLQLLQVFLVGMTLGMLRTVVPALADSEFGVPRGSFMLLVTFVVAFGLVKGVMNFIAGRAAEHYGRQKVLLAGWLAALPIPALVFFAPGWNWVVFATLLLGVNQGLAWSVTQTAKLDLTRADQRGIVIGLNELAGYVGVAVAGIVTGYAAQWLGAREGLLVFGLAIIVPAFLLAWLAVADTLPWARAEGKPAAPGASASPFRPRYPTGLPPQPTTVDVFVTMSWRDRRLAALCQAGLVEKFVDALVWVFLPVFLHRQGVGLPGIGWIVGIYGMVWGVSQWLTGRLSDHLGRHRLNVAGMATCGLGVVLMPLASSEPGWMMCAALTGFGMALLYPNLSAAVADIAPPSWRASAIGVYRFWRDIGYAVGALALGLVAAWGGSTQHGFWFVGIAMGLSALLLAWWGEETHPRINPAP